jgi:hypothetical protein
MMRFALLAVLLVPQESADLVGHWKLDDAKDAAAADSAGASSGKLVKEPKWVEGKLAGALALDGAGQHVEIPNSAALENVQEGNYSLAAWFKPAEVPKAPEDENGGSYCLVVKQGWHLGLRFNPEGHFVMDHWIKGEKEDEPVWAGGGTWETAYDAGKWYHVVGTVDRTLGKITVYVNGEAAGSGEFEAGKAAREYGQTPWRIGIGSPGAPKWSWPAKGEIDDVRIYKKALSEAEVQALCKAAAK